MITKKNIKIIQQMLKNENRYDLAVKLENCHYEDYRIDGLNGGIGEINLFVHPNHFMFFDKISAEDRELLIKLFDGLPHSYFEISSVKFSIDTKIETSQLSNTTYIFVDESGDVDFSKNGSKHYMFTFLVKKRPFRLHEYLSSYRYDLLEKNVEPFNRSKLDIESFHASYDNKYVRDEIFEIISTFEPESIRVYSYILEKPKVEPLKRKDRDKFYIENLKFAISRLLDKLQIDTNFIIITDRLPVKQNKKKQIKALKEGTKEYIVTNNLDIRYDIFHHCSASSVNLQIVDYMSWAIFRRYERGESTYYDKIKNYILEEELMTEKRETHYYEI